MTIAWNQPYRPVMIMAIIIGMLTGCASIFQTIDDNLQRTQFKSDYAAFEAALAQFNSGDFYSARTRFEALTTASNSKTIARRSRLGEICSRLATAHTVAEYKAAASMWYDFRSAVPENEALWALDLLDPLIVRLKPEKTGSGEADRRQPATTKRSANGQAASPPNKKQQRQKARQPDSPKQDARPKDDRQLQTELDALKKKVKDAEELQRQMDAVVTENRSLKKKIKALETIDQNIQKKKTEISAPTE